MLMQRSPRLVYEYGTKNGPARHFFVNGPVLSQFLIVSSREAFYIPLVSPFG
uniref:Uncharacterized protein MANES_12G011000 n=1 Tax=Rhizophora mucronata TaxID=61149 RepID=A0A2P2KJ10_RHIMU